MPKNATEFPHIGSFAGRYCLRRRQWKCRSTLLRRSGGATPSFAAGKRFLNNRTCRLRSSRRRDCMSLRATVPLALGKQGCAAGVSLYGLLPTSAAISSLLAGDPARPRPNPCSPFLVRTWLQDRAGALGRPLESLACCAADVTFARFKRTVICNESEQPCNVCLRN